jgi:hypothetical protein
MAMALYQSKSYPFSIEYPAEWKKMPKQPGITFGVTDGSNWFVIEEEDFGKEMGKLTLQEYTDFVVESVQEWFPDAWLASKDEIVNSQGLSMVILVFEGDSTSKAKVYRLIYVHEGMIGFNATYGCYATEYFERNVNYSFRTFLVNE